VAKLNTLLRGNLLLGSSLVGRGKARWGARDVGKKNVETVNKMLDKENTPHHEIIPNC
jgi:hypothetical protein